MVKASWLDRAVGWVAPTVQLRRLRARLAADLLLRHYEAASIGRRTSGWNRARGDANAVIAASLERLRDVSRDYVRNNGQGKAALRTIGNHVVGWGLVAKAEPAAPRLMEAWRAWAERTDCDADGRRNLYGLQKLVIRGVAESGEMLVRRRWRRLQDGYALPLQLQVLEPDFLDTGRSQDLPNGGYIINGVEFDPLGDRVAYWLFAKHPGATSSPSRTLFGPSRRIPASEVLHVFEGDRAGQVRGVPWFAPVLLPAKDLDEYRDAQVMKQKIAALLAVVTSDIDGTAAPLGTVGDTTTAAGAEIDQLEPGAVLNVPPGRSVTVVQPPKVDDYGPFVSVEERRIAKGLGLSYEDLTGDYSQVNFSSARMSRLEHYENVYDWRWQLLVPQFCEPVWDWAVEAAQLAGLGAAPRPRSRWTAPPMAMIEPEKEGLALQRNIRTGIQTLSDALRERGYDPDEALAEMAADNDRIDRLGLVLDSDPRRTTQAGQAQTVSEAVVS